MEKTLHFDSYGTMDQSVGDDLSPVVYQITIESQEGGSGISSVAFQMQHAFGFTAHSIETLLQFMSSMDTICFDN